MTTERFVAAGFGHSGTGWLANALAYLGVATTHEGIYSLAGIRPWPPRLAGDVSLAATPYLGGYDRRLFVVREPLRVLNSLRRTWKLAAQCPAHNPGDHLASPFGAYARSIGVDTTRDELDTIVTYLELSYGLAVVSRTPIARIEDQPDALPFTANYLADVAERHVTELLEEGTLFPTINAHGPTEGDRPPLSWHDLENHPAGERLHALTAELGYP